MSPHCHLFARTLPLRFFCAKVPLMRRSHSLNGIELHLEKELRIAGVQCFLRSNSTRVMSSLASWRFDSEDAPAGNFEMNILEDPALPSSMRYQPRFRGLHHLVLADFGARDTFILDVSRRAVNAVICSATAADDFFWNTTLLPLCVGVLGAALGCIPVHSACLDLDGQGLMIPAASTAGKSTLCAALSQRGFAVVSDGWAYITNGGNGVRAHGISPRIKLLPNATSQFPELHGRVPSKTSNGEIAFDVDPVETFGARVCRQTTPKWLLFIERTQTRQCDFQPLDPAAARRFFEEGAERLPECLAGFGGRRSEIFAALAARPSWLLRYGCEPRRAAEEIRRFCEEARPIRIPESESNTLQSENAVACDRHPDFLKRFVPTPFRASPHAGTMALDVATNDAACLRAIEAMAQARGPAMCNRFLWKVIRDEDARGALSEPMILHDGMSALINMGPGCIAAVDAERRELLAFTGADVNEVVLSETILPLFARFTRLAVHGGLDQLNIPAHESQVAVANE